MFKKAILLCSKGLYSIDQKGYIPLTKRAILHFEQGNITFLKCLLNGLCDTLLSYSTFGGIHHADYIIIRDTHFFPLMFKKWSI